MNLRSILLILLIAGAWTASAARADDAVRRDVLLPPKKDNPRNSEGDFIRLKDGRVMFIYTHFTGGGADHSTAHLAARVSTDGGLTWSKEDTRIPAKEAKQNVMSVSLLRLSDGKIALFYLVKNSNIDCRLYMHTSTDEAKTWSAPTLCIPDEGYYVVNNDRVVQLPSGRLIAPAAQHRNSLNRYDWRGIAMCYLSDDGGQTWRRSKTELHAPKESKSGLQEPGVVLLKDGRLMMFNRVDLGSQFLSYSSDNGDTWTEAQPSKILSPLSPATIERIPTTGDLLIAWNNHDGVDPSLKGKRTPLTVAISKDDGKTWQNIKNLETDPDGWYCYTAMDFVDGRVLLGHCGGKGFPRLAATQITSFPVQWLYQPGN